MSDLISRADAIEAVMKHKMPFTIQQEVAREIDALPSADAVHGEWIMHGEPPWLVRKCSECGTKWHQWSGEPNPNYCGHCGARMKDGDTE